MKKVHYDKLSMIIGGAPRGREKVPKCGAPLLRYGNPVEFEFTKHEDDVTCKLCLNLMGKHDMKNCIQNRERGK